MNGIINIIILLFAPFLFIGLINKTKAFWGGRKGAPVIQPFYNFIKLLRKGEVISTTATFIFRISPSVTLGSVLCAGLLVPIAGHRGIFSFEADFILFAYLLGIGKFFSLLGSLDVGNSFEGMGASREASFASMVEMAFFIMTASLASLAGKFSLSAVYILPQRHEQLIVLTCVLIIFALFLIMLLEGSRIPADDPDTHLELTMIHEVMVLDNSGPDLAFINYASGIKMVLIGSLIANMIIPSDAGIPASAAMVMGLLMLFSITIGTLESFIARFKLKRLPEFIFIISSSAVIVLCCVLLYKFRGLS
jgi:formate hydrogenlyase subunit 4